NRAELVGMYEERSGRSMSDLRWYVTLALWKSAIFLEGSYKRRLAGTTDDPFFDKLEHGVPELADRAWETASSGNCHFLSAVWTDVRLHRRGPEWEALTHLRQGCRRLGQGAGVPISQGMGQVAVRRAADRLEATAARSGYRRRRQLSHPPAGQALVG